MVTKKSPPAPRIQAGKQPVHQHRVINGSLALTMNDNNHSTSAIDHQGPQPVLSFASIPSSAPLSLNASLPDAVPSSLSAPLSNDKDNIPSMTNSKMVVTRKRSNSKDDNIAANTADDALDLIERIIQTAESRHQSSNQREIVEGGPFTQSELSQLSLLQNDVWSTIEGDTLVSLTGMLQTHVVSGVGMDLVGEGRNVVKWRENGGDGPVISVQQVIICRRDLLIRLCVKLLVSQYRIS
jgi:hypothetical protein